MEKQVTNEMIYAELRRISAKLTLMMVAKKKETWVKPSVITEVTGWQGSKLQWARESNLVDYKKNGYTCLYLLESIPERFITKK